MNGPPTVRRYFRLRFCLIAYLYTYLAPTLCTCNLTLVDAFFSFPHRQDSFCITMTSIHDLPDEILLEIVASIDRDPYHREFKTYRALCSTSRRLYKIAVPLLYERYELSGWETSRNRDGEYKSHGVFSERQRSRHHFVRTLAASPELANLVKSIRYANEQDPWRPFVCDDHMLDKMVYKIRGKHAPPQAVLALMLCLTQNVEAIDVRNNTQQPFSIFVGLEPVFKAALGISFSSVHQFKHLKSITVDYSSTRLINLMPLFKLSSIRKLSFKSCTWKPYPNALATIYTLSPLETALFEREYRSSPVTSIILEGLVPAPLLKGMSPDVNPYLHLTIHAQFRRSANFCVSSRYPSMHCRS